MKAPFVITIVGPESSGKTTLARELAAGVNCSWVPEYARTFLTQLNRPYEFDDLVQLSHEQIQGIETALRYWQNKPLVDVTPIEQWVTLQDSFDLNEFIRMLKPYHDDVLIIDSGTLTLQQWAWIKYQKRIDVVEEALLSDPTSLYLLTRAKKTWEADPLREAPHFIERVWIYNQYLHALSNMTIPFYSVNDLVIHTKTD